MILNKDNNNVKYYVLLFFLYDYLHFKSGVHMGPIYDQGPVA